MFVNNAVKHTTQPVTLFAKIDGVVTFERYGKTRKKVSIVPVSA